MELLKNLNSMQKEAVLNIEGPLLLLAGAGSGKTRVITYKIAHMIQEGVSPLNILAITFTNKASKEMKERVKEILKEDSVWISTFHSTCIRILRKEIHKINYDNNFIIYDRDDSERVVKECLKELNLNDKNYPPKTVMSYIGSFKDELKKPSVIEKEFFDDFRMSQISKVYTLYQKKLKNNNCLDFDDIIFNTVELFRNSKETLEKYQEKFKYILVDEYQDTNTAQYELIKLLSGKYKNICVVGDDDQSIYAFRGANIKNILNFEKDFKNAKVIKLEQNYRSTKKILDIANCIIKNNSSRKGKNLWTENNENSDTIYHKALNDMEEALFVINKINNYITEGKKYKDIAILYRQNSLSRIIEDQLVKKNIPYRIFGGIRFYERKEIKDILAYLRVIYNTFDNVSLKRIINTPKRGIGDATIEKIDSYATSNDISFFDALGNLDNINAVGNRSKKLKDFKNIIDDLIVFSKDNDVSKLIEEILKSTNYLESLEKEEKEKSIQRTENIQEFINKAIEFESSSEDKSLSAFLEDVSLVSDMDNFSETDDTIVLMTLHSSKGLEFPTVFLVGFEEGIFPSYRSIMAGNEKEIEEERRLCYVGVTRAKENLYITSSNSRMQNGKIVYNSSSRFLKEIPENLINHETQRNHIKNASLNKQKEVKHSDNKIKNNYKSLILEPKNVKLDFKKGDKVKQMRYGIGVVKDIKPAGADFEVTVKFEKFGEKKFMANFSNLKKV